MFQFKGKIHDVLDGRVSIVSERNKGVTVFYNGLDVPSQVGQVTTDNILSFREECVERHVRRIILETERFTYEIDRTIPIKGWY